MEINYPARITPQEGGGFLVQFVDLPDTFTEGQTLEEALFNAAEVLSAMVGWHLDQGRNIPAATPGLLDAHYISPDAKTQAVLLLRHARGGRSLADLARALETSWPQAKRLEDPHHWPSLKTLDRAARVLGKRLVLSME
ncbi:MAG TPA: HicB family protein [Polaromonas sp.]|uniref:type II toxin-antitoxin system HicB family antitoxin n=1 Tax=Polaromonas sp. UBA4122 TaxID=1947074 RepID=UPI000EC32B59|nr:type II toxin-antitoxin system HicB family antitoxin [Polaromonas sp. UBA4122]HAL37240.1 HicB family protein [Polaromonas sp.]